MTNKQILDIAMAQSAVDSACLPSDFTATENKIVISAASSSARRYLSLPFECDLTSYGSNIVASVSPELAGVVRDYISRYPVEHCFETPNLHILIEALRPYDVNVCFMAEYFLPNLDRLSPLSCPNEIKILTAADFAPLYTPEWSNALCEKRRELDVLGVGAYDGDKLIGLAACSADCDSMWQIGIDVAPDYRRRGIASALTSRLACEILRRGIVPFYCCAWSNIGSARNAIKSGFAPAWVQLTIKKNDFIADMNR